MIDIDIIIEDPRWETLGLDINAVADKAVRAAIRQAEPPAFLEGHEFALCALFTNDEALRILNRDFRDKDKPTNILSFATLDDPDCEDMLDRPGPFYLGDLALAFETLKREAEEQSKALPDHFTHLLVHGTLHLLGYDHQDDSEAEKMESLEIKVLSSLGIKDPYNLVQTVPD